MNLNIPPSSNRSLENIILCSCPLEGTIGVSCRRTIFTSMKKLIVLSLFFPLFGWTQSANDILTKAISYHDPSNSWQKLDATLSFTETRPEGADRKTTVVINNKTGEVTINRNDEEIYKVVGDKAEMVKGDKEEDRGLILRNYYLYLWGLPMKLKDESTPEITLEDQAEVNGETTNVLRVEYEADTWYFYFDEETGRMLEYKFYKDEEAGKGELLKLEEEVEIDGIKIPKKRSWYTLPEMKYLGTDILDGAE